MAVSERRSVLAVVVVGLVLRGAALWATAGAPLVLDEVTYAIRAEALLDGRGFLGSYQSWVRHDDGTVSPAELPQYPGAWQPPAQTAFMAAVLALGGRSLLAVKLAQVLLGGLSVWLVYALGRAWFDHRAGLAAAWLAALYPNLVAFCHYLWSETLFVFLLLLSLWLLTRRRPLPTPGAAALAGVVLGAAALTRATIFYFLPVLVAWLAFSNRGQWRRGAARGLLLAGMAALLIAPWSVRNTQLHGGFVLLETNGPYNLWRGNGPDSFAGRDDPAQPHYAWPFESVPLAPVLNRPARRLVQEAKQALGSETPTDLEVIGHARDVAWQTIRSDPGLFVARMRYRLADLWNPTSFLIRHLRIGAYGNVPPALAALVTAAAALGYLLVMAFGIAGLWRARRRPEAWLVALLVGYLSAVSAVSFGLTRFRLPVMPLLMVLAGPPLLASAGRLRGGGARAAAVAGSAGLLLACGPGPPPREGPNVLWVLWDTVRSDRLSLYGHEVPTSPRLSAWAKNARVFENATSTAGYTIPSHASMFTGLLPSEHCTHNANERLDDGYVTLAELLRDDGFQTFLYSENPNLTAAPARNFAQGFERVTHPWSPEYLDEAFRIAESKLPEQENTSELRQRLEAARSGEGPLTPWNVKAAGVLGRKALVDWLEGTDRNRPWFAFLNFMEAHRPYIPPRRYRERVMSDGEVERSYRVDRSWIPMWEYVFGLREYDEDSLELTRKTYDATLLELDELLADLLDALEAGGWLRDTVVVLTSDHGEHLGEQHMLDHQYSVYEPALRVPLVLYAPSRVAPGRSAAPVVNFDVFPTLLELTGVAPPPGLDSSAVSLLAPREGRGRIAEEPAASDIGIAQVRERHPGWDPTSFQRRLRAWTDGPWKVIWRSDGSTSLYDLAADPWETRDLAQAKPEQVNQQLSGLERFRASRASCRIAPPGRAQEEMTPQERDRLEALGYLGESDAHE